MDYRGASDEELWRLCQRDDSKAFSEFVYRYAPRLHKIGNRYLQDRFVVEELVMDLLFNLWERRNQVDIKQEVSGYLFNALRYKILRELQRKKIPHTVTWYDLGEYEMPHAYQESDSRLSNDQVQAAYNNFKDKLAPQCKKVFELSREEDLSYQSIAENTGLSVNTVKKYISSALETFRQNQGKYFFALFLLLHSLL